MGTRYHHSAKLWEDCSEEGWGRDEEDKGGLRCSPLINSYISAGITS
jgi:hypothetical protein